MSTKITLYLFLFTAITAFSQSYTSVDTVYTSQIQSVKVYDDSFIRLDANDFLEIEFDWMGESPAYIYFIIEHCDRNWNPSPLQKSEYLEGFDDSEIRDYEFVQARHSAYYHYRLSLPNRNVQFRKSGNYLVHLYNSSQNEPLITRRIVVYEDLVQVKPTILRGTDIQALQALDIKVDLKKHKVRDPKMDMAISVLQNGNWYTAQTDLRSNFFMSNELIYQRNDVQFSAGKDYRTLDARFLRTKGRQIEEVNQYEDGFEILKYPDRPLKLQNILTDQDLNGNYFYQNGDEPRSRLRIHELQYVDISLALENFLPGTNQEIYVVGGFTNWQCLPQYQLKYLDTDELWEAYFPLKQGLYDYSYAIRNNRTGEVNYYDVDGNWYETQNLYQIIVYQKTWEASSYDRVIGVGVLE